MPNCALLPGAAQSACPGYRSTAVCHTVARTDAQHRLRVIMPLRSIASAHCALLPGAAQAPAGLQVHCRLPYRSRTAQHRLRGIMPHCALGKRLPGYRSTAVCHTVAGQMRSIASELRSAPGGGAKRLPGLQVHRRLPYRSPDSMRSMRCSGGQAPARATGPPPSAIP
ncbi:hypothetical protein ACRCN4_19875 [Klebsiella michiganensis]|uniref:hypothetical protein n=1 Tax=Klebsiella michiganensis TaxID=1134687 RepID=UPI003D997EC5